MTASRFTSDDPGTSEHSWAEALASLTAPAVHRPSHLVIVSAHPDDEALGCGGLMSDVDSDVTTVTVVLASWGEASHPESPTHPPTEVAQRRQAEMRHALDELAGDGNPIRLRALGLPDGELDRHHDELTAAVVDAVGGTGDQALILAPWHRDGHPDHAAAGRAGAAAAARTDADFLEYPIWFWHWASPEALAHSRWRSHRLTREAKATKAAAVAAHRTQTQPLSPDPRDRPVLTDGFLAHFARDHEYFVSELRPVDYDAFEPLHQSHPDPWDTRSEYERGKRAATIAVIDTLGPVRSTLEIGCSVGALTADIARHSDRVDALEPSAAARAAASAATANLPAVTILSGAAPQDIPRADYDLIVLSETGYFLSPFDLCTTLDRIHANLRAGRGHLLACHWIHPIAGWVLDGPTVHRMIDDHPGFKTIETPTGIATGADYELRLWRAR